MSEGSTKATIYHNPNCTKSRLTLALLEEKGIAPTVVKYLETPPTVEDISSILEMLNMEPRQLMRKKEAPYADNNLEDPALDRQTLIQFMHDNPKLIERPIIVANGRAAIGRPPEDVLPIL